MRAQYDENLHDFQVQFRREMQQAENITVLFNAHLLTIETDETQGHVTELNCSTIVFVLFRWRRCRRKIQSARPDLCAGLRRH